MQHPKEKIVCYFGGTPVGVNEQGSSCHSPRKKKPKQGSPTSPPSNNPNVIGQGQQREKSLNNLASEATVVGTYLHELKPMAKKNPNDVA